MDEFWFFLIAILGFALINTITNKHNRDVGQCNQVCWSLHEKATYQDSECWCSTSGIQLIAEPVEK